jgi:hypothetical protein
MRFKEGFFCYFPGNEENEDATAQVEEDIS